MACVFTSSNTPAKIAHFNHHLRPDSNLDEALVRDFSIANNIDLVVGHGEDLSGSEEDARRARHAFFAGVIAESEAAKATPAEEATYSLAVATGHHLDDLVESVAINLHRGTGWRGLAVLNRDNYIRPLLELEKSEVISLTKELGVKWREDSTNQSSDYLRNRLRQKTASLSFDTKWHLLKLRHRQVSLLHEITQIINQLNLDLSNRHLYKSLDDDVALELLRHHHQVSLLRTTRPELTRLLAAIRTYQPQKKHQLSNNHFILIRKDDFIKI
ncbi:tRNA lysidine(34) synthetase TilS [Candidatus Saccharibacteria bacterium]|nr:tRNA lysidine(34) synthetase TilS [Candidatus Saccharibacteria bacterium]